MDPQIVTQRITAAGPRGTRVSTRRQQFDVGPPLEFDVEAEGVAAVEYVCGALGAELVGGFRAFAKRHRVAIDDIEAVVHGEIEHPLAYLEVVGAEGRPRIRRLHAKVFVSTAADRDVVQRLWHATLERLPVVGTLQPAVELVLELEIT